MRTKFETPHEPTDNELMFIQYMTSTHDSYGLSEQTLSTFLGISKREVRRYKERYNNFKYIGYAPLGKIHNIKNEHGTSLYKLVRKDSKYYTQKHLRVEYNFICAYLEKWNTRKIWGDIQLKGQLTIDDLNEMNATELIELAKSYEEALGSDEE
jgi:hypothetical protein